jgi:hypothetical protein
MRTGMKLRTLVAAMAVTAAAGCASAPTATSPPGRGGPGGYWTRARLLGAEPWRRPGFRLGQPTTAHAAELSVRVGALFEHDLGGNHFCTASVVPSPGRDLLITAAHCITGTIVGVLGGYQEGGSTAAISYSSYLGEEIQRLYRQAVADEAAPAG